MTGIDWTIICVYLIGMIAMSVYLGRGQEDDADYYVGGRKLPWWAVGISVVATQSSAISFVSVPAFVALREGGGLAWLQYELAVPIAMVFVMLVLVPYFRGLQLVSVFEFLEARFGSGTAKLLSTIFLLSRGFGTGVGVYATAVVLSSMMQLPTGATILIIGIAAIIYDTIGGITAVVWSDVIQLGLIVLGAILCIAFAANEVGSFGALFQTVDPARLDGFQPGTGLGDGETIPFWAFLIGGFFLYASYYGTDQSQVQRVLCTSSTEEASRSLFLNGIARLPLTCLYLLLGLAIGATYQVSPELRDAVTQAGSIDSVVPKFILIYLPSGVRGVLLAAILAAAMSSLDSAINSLSAVTMRDYVEPRIKLSKRQQLFYGKVTTVLWGLVVTAFAFGAGGISKTVIEATNKVGSAFFGPVLAAFVIGVLTRSVGGAAMIVAVLAGVSLNLTLWLTEAPVHWMWWNAFGFALTGAIAMVSTRFVQPPQNVQVPEPKSILPELSLNRSHYMLFGYFVFILVLIASTHVLFG
ncbi:MAG: sodium/solute symporter [Myxococcota bacterium]